MPTGYTADLKPDSDFATFALTCTRAMGVAILQRDDAPGPVKLPELDRRHEQGIAKYRAQLEALESIAPEEAAARTEVANAEAKKAYKKNVRRNTQTETAYRNMLAKVEAWQPPTESHEGLQKFMREQLTESLRWDIHEPEQPTVLTVADWIAAERKNIQWNIDFHEKYWASDQKAHAERHEWILKLQESLA